MATDIWQDRILFAVRKLIESGTSWKCYDLKPRGAECLVFVPNPEFQLNSTTSGTVFRYPLDIEVYTATATDADREAMLQQLANIKRILNDNTHYQTGGINYYFDGSIEGVEYDWDDEEENHWKARIAWSATHEEVV